MLSSVASRMYWVGRYLERAENTARLVDVYTNLLLDLPRDAGVSWTQLIRITGEEAAFDEFRAWPIERSAVKFLVANPSNPGSIMSSVAAARENTRTLRDVVPREAFEAINELFIFTRKRANRASGRRARRSVLSEVVSHCQQITGLFAGTMSHGPAYEFLRLGRNLERADMTTRIVDVAGEMLTSSPDTYANHESILWMNVLRSLSAYQMYRQSVRSRIAPVRVMHFVMNDELFPRSFAHCLREIDASCSRLPNGAAPRAAVSEVQKRLHQIGLRDLAGKSLHDYIDTFQLALGDIHTAIEKTWFEPHTRLKAAAA